MKEARELLLKHLYLQGGDGLGISDGRVYNACLDAIMEALTIPVVVKSLPSKDAEFIYSLLPEWTREVLKGLDPTMYGTLTYEGDKEIVDKLKEILK